MPAKRKHPSKRSPGDKLAELAKNPPHRNDAFFDYWSIVHFVTGVAMGWVMAPFLALALMVLWEPFEIFVLSPILAKFGIRFGFESLRNSLSDILFDTLGVIAGAYILGSALEPPFFLL